MRFLRHHKLRWMVSLVLAMVFTIGGMPAPAVACGDLSAPAPALQGAPEARAESCEPMGAAGPCCCGPQSEAITAAHAEPAPGAEFSRSGCGCSIQAPAPPAADRKTAALGLWLDAAALPAAAVWLQLPISDSSAFTAAITGPPRSPVRSSGPSRAPPAC